MEKRKPPERAALLQKFFIINNVTQYLNRHINRANTIINLMPANSA